MKAPGKNYAGRYYHMEKLKVLFAKAMTAGWPGMVCVPLQRMWRARLWSVLVSVWSVVLFAVGNTAGAPTLDVGNTGPKPIRYRNAVISSEILAAGRTYAFIYDGEAYELIGDVNTDTGTTYEVGTGLELSGATLSVKYGNSAGTSCQGNDTRLSGGEDWSKSKKDIVDRITSLESGGGVEAGDGLDKSGKTLSVKYGNGKGTALEGDGTAANAKKWNGSSLTISSAAPSGGSDADIWLTWI